MPRFYPLVLLAFALLVVATGCDTSTFDGNAPADRTPLSPADISTGAADALNAQDRYIVVFNDNVGQARALANRLANDHGAEAGFVYEHALKGFSVALPAQAAAALERNPNVAYVVPDRVVTIAAQSVPTGIRRAFADTNPNIGIDGVDDQRVDVDVAVIDTGIDLQHPDLNIGGGVDCTNGSPWNASCSSGGDDDHYHGTHVAGSVAALDNGIGVVGVAPGARVWAVKVLNSQGSGYSSWIIAGIDWVAANAGTIEVANMSLGGSGYNQAEYDAIQGAVNAGVAFAVAAGNDADDANNYSPAAFDNALTVSALADFDGNPGGTGSATCRADEDDTLANFSNYGSAVQIAAPGVCITSTFPLEQGEYATISGTSMASPHAAGALALLASSNNPGNANDVYALYDQVINAGNFNWTDESGDGVKEPLLDVSTFTATLVPTGDPGGGGGSSIDLTANGYKQKGRHHIDLSWSGASSTSVDVYRDGNVVATTANDGAYTDATGRRGGATYTYKVCEAGTSTCSADVQVVF